MTKTYMDGEGKHGPTRSLRYRLGNKILRSN